MTEKPLAILLSIARRPLRHVRCCLWTQTKSFGKTWLMQMPGDNVEHLKSELKKVIKGWAVDAISNDDVKRLHEVNASRSHNDLLNS